MIVKYIGKNDIIALVRDKTYKVLSEERDCFRIRTEINEICLFHKSMFEIVKDDIIVLDGDW